MSRLVEFITPTKLPRKNDDTGRWETDRFEVEQVVELDDDRAALAIGNGWAREVSVDD